MKRMKQNNKAEWHLNYIQNYQADRADLMISHYDEKTNRLYEIKLCPTISLAVTLLNRVESEQEKGNHKIIGTLQINNFKDFTVLWNALKTMLNDSGNAYPEKARFSNLPDSPV
jgi:hypothetical protein